MFIVNKTDSIQRTMVKWNKQDVKPWEIVEVKEDEAIYITKAYWEIFWLSAEAKKREVKKEKKVFSKK